MPQNNPAHPHKAFPVGFCSPATGGAQLWGKDPPLNNGKWGASFQVCRHMDPTAPAGVGAVGSCSHGCSTWGAVLRCPRPGNRLSSFPQWVPYGAHGLRGSGRDGWDGMGWGRRGAGRPRAGVTGRGGCRNLTFLLGEGQQQRVCSFSRAKGYRPHFRSGGFKKGLERRAAGMRHGVPQACWVHTEPTPPRSHPAQKQDPRPSHELIVPGKSGIRSWFGAKRRQAEHSPLQPPLLLPTAPLCGSAWL